MTRLIDHILNLVQDAHNKTIVEVGSHDDSLTIQLAAYFKQVDARYEFVKVPERASDNYSIQKTPYPEVLRNFAAYDVVLLRNEFHHFPDIWQMWTYSYLQPDQELLLVEWDFTGNNDYYYSAFQNCHPLCLMTRSLLNRFIAQEIIKFEAVIKGKEEITFKSAARLVEYYHRRLPDHWPFGAHDFLGRIANVVYPFTIWEGYDLFKIRKMSE